MSDHEGQIPFGSREYYRDSDLADFGLTPKELILDIFNNDFENFEDQTSKLLARQLLGDVSSENISQKSQAFIEFSNQEGLTDEDRNDWFSENTSGFLEVALIENESSKLKIENDIDRVDREITRLRALKISAETEMDTLQLCVEKETLIDRAASNSIDNFAVLSAITTVMKILEELES